MSCKLNDIHTSFCQDVAYETLSLLKIVAVCKDLQSVSNTINALVNDSAIQKLSLNFYTPRRMSNMIYACLLDFYIVSRSFNIHFNPFEDCSQTNAKLSSFKPF